VNKSADKSFSPVPLPVAIIAGGLATRLGGLARQTPKALLPVAGEPFIHHQLRLLARYGVVEVTLCSGYLGEMIQAAVGDGREFGLRVRHIFDGPELRGTGGALKNALPLLGEAFMTIYGDSYLEIDYLDVARAFAASEQPALMTVYCNEGRFDTSNVVFEKGRIVHYDKKNQTPDMRHIDYGLGCLKASVLADWPGEKFDLAEVYKCLCREGRLAGYESPMRFYEIGSRAGLEELDARLSATKG
jgi:NDP-sugar pyrophosphorylase family protein